MFGSLTPPPHKRLDALRVRTVPFQHHSSQVNYECFFQQLKKSIWQQPFCYFFKHAATIRKKRRPGNRIHLRRCFQEKPRSPPVFTISSLCNKQNRKPQVMCLAPYLDPRVRGYSRVVYLRCRVHYMHESSSPHCSIALAHGLKDAVYFYYSVFSTARYETFKVGTDTEAVLF